MRSLPATEAPASLLDRVVVEERARLFAWSERRFVAHGFAERREERVVVELVAAVDRVGLDRDVASASIGNGWCSAVR